MESVEIKAVKKLKTMTGAIAYVREAAVFKVWRYLKPFRITDSFTLTWLSLNPTVKQSWIGTVPSKYNFFTTFAIIMMLIIRCRTQIHYAVFRHVIEQFP